jgi:hypothetical protein
MRKSILLAAAVVMLTALASAFAAHPAQAAAASNYCKHRYNICLARCAAANRRCLNRCRSQYRYCTYRSPYLGDLL